MRIIDFRKQDHEFVATVTADRIRGADAGLQTLGNGLQQLIANPMPHCVVDMLEVVEVQKHQRHLFAVALCEQDRLHQTIGQKRPVRQSGEQIMLGHVGQMNRDSLDRFGHHVRVDRGNDEIFVCFPERSLHFRTEIDLDLFGILARPQRLLDRLQNFLLPVGKRLAMSVCSCFLHGLFTSLVFVFGKRLQGLKTRRQGVRTPLDGSFGRITPVFQACFVQHCRS